MSIPSIHVQTISSGPTPTQKAAKDNSETTSVRTQEVASTTITTQIPTINVNLRHFSQLNKSTEKTSYSSVHAKEKQATEMVHASSDQFVIELAELGGNFVATRGSNWIEFCEKKACSLDLECKVKVLNALVHKRVFGQLIDVRKHLFVRNSRHIIDNFTKEFCLKADSLYIHQVVMIVNALSILSDRKNLLAFMKVAQEAEAFNIHEVNKLNFQELNCLAKSLAKLRGSQQQVGKALAVIANETLKKIHSFDSLALRNAACFTTSFANFGIAGNSITKLFQGFAKIFVGNPTVYHIDDLLLIPHNYLKLFSERTSPKLIKAASKEILRRRNPYKSTQTMRDLMTMLAGLEPLEKRAEQLFEQIVEPLSTIITAHLKDFSDQELIQIIHSIALIGCSGKASKELFEKIVRLRRGWTIPHLVTIAWSILAYGNGNVRDPQAILQILNWCNSYTQFTSKDLIKIHHILLCLSIFHPHLNILNSYPEMQKRIAAALEEQKKTAQESSEFHEEVFKTLSGISPHPIKPIHFVEGYFVNLVIDEEPKVAIELEEPYSITSHDALREVIFCHLGWSLLTIKIEDWECVSLDQRSSYLSKLLSNSEQLSEKMKATTESSPTPSAAKAPSQTSEKEKQDHSQEVINPTVIIMSHVSGPHSALAVSTSSAESKETSAKAAAAPSQALPNGSSSHGAATSSSALPSGHRRYRRGRRNRPRS